MESSNETHGDRGSSEDSRYSDQIEDSGNETEIGVSRTKRNYRYCPVKQARHVLGKSALNGGMSPYVLALYRQRGPAAYHI